MNFSPINNANNTQYIRDIQPANANLTAGNVSYKNSLEKDKVEFSGNKTQLAQQLREELKSIKKEQGLIGKVWDGAKNLFNFGASSNKVENTIKKYETGEISKEEAQETIQKYKDGQKMCTDVVGDIASGIIAVGAAALAPVTGGASLLVAAGAGSISKVGIKALDAAIGGREYKLNDLWYDFATGSINGAIAPVSNALGGAAGTGIAKACGLKVVQTGTKSAGKGIIARLLAKQGATCAAKEGTKLGAGIIGAKILSYGVDMAVDGALSGAADGFSRALGEGRIEDIKEDTLNSALGGLIAAPVIGGSTRAIFKGASFLGSKATKSIVKESSSTFRFNNIDDAVEHLKKSANPKAKEVLSEYSNLIAKNKQVSLASLNSAIDLLDDPKSVEKIQNYANILAKEYADDTSMRKTIGELMGALGIDSEITYDAEKKIYKIDTQYGKMTARAKGEDSIFSKVRNKILGLKEEIPTDKEFASAMIGDAHGTRIVVNNITITDDEIIKIIKANCDNAQDCKMFAKYITEGKGVIPENKLAQLGDIEKKVYEVATERQSGEIARKIAQAIENEDLKVIELHNYVGENGVPYFNKIQVDNIQEAYTNWFNAKYKIAKKTPDASEYKIVLDGYKTFLEDKNGFKFPANMTIESYHNSEKAIKKTGYTAAQMNIITKNGVQEELQYRGVLTDKLAELEHIPYDISKNKDTILKPKYDQVRGVFNKYKDNKEFDKLYRSYSRDTYNAYRKMEIGLRREIPDIKDYLGKILSEDEMNIISFDGLEKVHNIK